MKESIGEIVPISCQIGIIHVPYQPTYVHVELFTYVRTYMWSFSYCDHVIIHPSCVHTTLLKWEILLLLSIALLTPSRRLEKHLNYLILCVLSDYIQIYKCIILVWLIALRVVYGGCVHILGMLPSPHTHCRPQV